LENNKYHILKDANHLPHYPHQLKFSLLKLYIYLYFLQVLTNYFTTQSIKTLSLLFVSPVKGREIEINM